MAWQGPSQFQGYGQMGGPAPQWQTSVSVSYVGPSSQPPPQVEIWPAPMVNTASGATNLTAPTSMMDAPPGWAPPNVNVRGGWNAGQCAASNFSPQAPPINGSMQGGSGPSGGTAMMSDSPPPGWKPSGWTPSPRLQSAWKEEAPPYMQQVNSAPAVMPAWQPSPQARGRAMSGGDWCQPSMYHQNSSPPEMRCRANSMSQQWDNAPRGRVDSIGQWQQVGAPAAPCGDGCWQQTAPMGRARVYSADVGRPRAYSGAPAWGAGGGGGCGYSELDQMLRNTNMFTHLEPKEYYRKETFTSRTGEHQYTTFAVPKKVNR